jgi:pimeloyl-ACP methyl ester carboxylesterase
MGSLITKGTIMPGPEDLVLGGDVAVRDFGGSGPPVLLLHGAGANLMSMQALARELSPRFRVITADLRGHGRSGDDPWEWEAVLGDLEAVRDELGLPEPIVAGWSLGGMIAALWAVRHPGCPAAVSFDGTPPPTCPDQCAGIDPDQARADLEQLHAAFSAMRDSMARPLTPSDVQAALDQHREMARRHGAPEDMAAEGFRRNLTTRDGQTWLRPLPQVLAALQTAMAELDIISVYHQVKCPLLVALATDDLPEQQPFHELYAAYRRGFEGRLAEAAAANPCLRVAHVEGATHAMVAERPVELARLVTTFTRTCESHNCPG